MPVLADVLQQPAAQMRRAIERASETRIGDGGQQLGRQEASPVCRNDMTGKLLDVQCRVGAAQLMPFTLDRSYSALHLHGERFRGEECT
ncbi:hypothetical protein J7I88_19375 [Paraburkholderia strydomiana]|nr:hypothetical protein [Paraburkholderia strydomiana]